MSTEEKLKWLIKFHEEQFMKDLDKLETSMRHAAGNQKFMQIAGPARQAINLAKSIRNNYLQMKELESGRKVK